MYRSYLARLAFFFLLISAITSARGATPFAGTWKVLVPEQQFEVNLWVLKIDKEAKEIEILAGATPAHKDAKLSNLKAEEKSLRFSLALAPTQGVLFHLLPPTKDDADTVLGTVMIGTNVLPVWLEKTEQTEIDSKKVAQVVGAFADLEAALKKMGEERIKGLYEVTTAHPARPVGILAFNLLLGELNRTKADAKEYEKYANAVLKGMAPFGPIMVVGRNLQLANVMRGDPKLAGLALERSREAVKLLQPDSPVTLRMTAQLGLADSLVTNDKKAEADKVAPEAKKIAEEVISRQKEPMGKLFATQAMATTLLRSPAAAIADDGLLYAREAVKMVKEDAPLAQRAAVQRLLLMGLKMRGKEEEAAALAPKVEKLETELDTEFAKTNVPFEVKPFAGRKGESKRVVLVEMFNMIHDPGTVAAGSAFDATGKGYTSKDVVLLQYHLPAVQPMPMANPLANSDAEQRQKFYDEDAQRPGTLVVNGKPAPLMRGTLKEAEKRFDTLVEVINKGLEVPEEAAIKLEIKRDGETLEMTAEVTGLKEPGDNVKLRFALVEEVVRFQGNSGYRLHRHVVRALPGGPAGIKLDRKDSTNKITLNLEDLRKVLASYQKEFATRIRSQVVEGPMKLENLKVIAFIQLDDSKHVLQAVQVDVPAK